MSLLSNFETRVFAMLRRPAPTGWVHRSVFWLLLASVAAGLLGLLPGGWGGGFQALSNVLLIVLVPLAAVLLTRYIFGRFLWKVRNRLIMTYVLMGLAPVVLFVTLAGIALWVFSGQFAIFAGQTEEHAELVQIAAENRVYATRVAQEINARVPNGKLSLPGTRDMAAKREFPDLRLAVFVDGKPVKMKSAGVDALDITKVPEWLGDRDFEGVVFDHGRLYLRAVDSEAARAHRVTVISSMPLGQKNMDRIAAGLGTVTVVPNPALQNDKTIGTVKVGRRRYRFEVPQKDGKSGQTIQGESLAELYGAGAVVGGKLPQARHFFDIPVSFMGQLRTTIWQTGKPHHALVQVNSRPSLLYKRLFSASLEVGYLLRDALIGLAAFFGFLELMAFYGAMRLNTTITKSIRDLYSATEAIDRGDFEHRIVVKRRDQLAALSQSFNDMTASLGRLLTEQKEKQKLQSELVIAQEVQANLFPGANLQLGALEVYGTCLPARTVSGDYYDFLVVSEKALGIALGDISGKGISAALLMATLHSAVRAYRFAGHEMAVAAQSLLAKTGWQSPEFDAESGRMFAEPARILKLLNRHLYRSTQPEKYATLFLAHLEVESRQLTYANGGQLPPLLLRADGSVDRMDLGGTVVGLIDDVGYEQGVERMEPGDILIAYSDGVTEPENEFGEFGEARLVEVVARHRHLPLEVIAGQVMHALRAWIGEQEQPDDITLVLARYGQAEALESAG